MVCLGGVADGGGDVVLFKGYDGCHFVCMIVCLVEPEYRISLGCLSYTS